MRKLVLLFIICMMAIDSTAQVLCLENQVEVQTNNIYAARNPRKDAKGVPCGVLMLHSTIEGLTFKGSVVGDVQNDAGVYVIYLPQNTKKLEAVAPSGSVLKIDLPKIESKATYTATVYYEYEKGSLVCASDPSGASVTLISGSERTDLGKTPLKGNVEVLTGVYNVEVSKSGFQTVVKSNVKISSGKTTNLGTVKLTKSGKVGAKQTHAANENHTYANRDARSEQNNYAGSRVQGRNTENTLFGEPVFENVEQQAEFPGGMPALMKWICNNIIYPEIAVAEDIQGRVVVKFIIDKFGKVISPKIVKGVHPELDREAIRLVSSMPKWQPAKHQGREVASYFTFPVQFRLKGQ
ncbi:MAG: TonB family protein [Muribaculaceae bacterium]|nr:TonB family protein [Muribaculaceae bacterium]